MTGGPRPGRFAEIGQWTIVSAGLALILVAILARFTIASVWDDAYIVLRYTDQALAAATLAWNAGESPTYGLTSPLYLAIVIPVRAVMASSPALAALTSSLGCGLVAISLMVQLVSAGRPPTGPQRVPAVLLVTSLASNAGSLADHLTSGMDTAFAMVWLAVYLLLAGRRSSRAALLAGVWGGLSFLARPDLLLFTLSIPVVMYLLSSTPGDRLQAARMLTSTVVTLGLELALTTAYFDSTLPLPFYAKGTHLYGASIQEAYAGVGASQLRQFVRSYWILFLIPALAIFSSPRRWRQEGSPLEKGVLTGTLLFFGYQAFLVLPIMFYSQRFYYPALPALAYLTGCGLRPMASRDGQPGGWSLAYRAGVAFASGLAILGLARTGVTEVRALSATLTGERFAQFNLTQHFKEAGMASVWPGLDLVSALPDDVTIATTEVGLPAAMNPDKRIIDLAGLNQTDIALGRRTPEAVLRAERPDVLYLPHPDYREMNRAIRSDPDLLSRYDFASEPARPPALDVAILRASRHARALRGLLGAPGADP